MIQFNKTDEKLKNIAALMEKKVKANADLTLVIDRTMDEFDAEIKNGVIRAGDYGQLLDACGRYLRNPKIEGEFHSYKDVCGIYFAAHDDNYLDMAPVDEICDYLDDLALWGMNHFKIWLDLAFHEDIKEEKCQNKIKRHKAMLRRASELGIKTSLVAIGNEAFYNSPEHLRADWTCGHDGYIYDLNDHYHVEICPSKEGGMEKIIEYRRQMLEEFKDAPPDYISFGAYDEGGCTCSKCAPWGSNGYVRCLETLIPVVREYMPNVKFIASLWQFGTFTGDDREYIGFKKVMEEGRLSEIDYLSSEPQYARYPFEHGMPRPILNFPEISMFGAYPWGGFGTNPLPKLMEGLWKNNGHKVAGGYAYSEGMYEDLNKVIILRQYRDNQSSEDTIREYLNYEFGLTGEVLENTVQAVMAMEETLPRSNPYATEIPHSYIIEKPEKIPFIEKAIIEADKTLSDEVRNTKKWKLIYLRAVIDGELLRNNFVRNEKTLAYFHELTQMGYLETALRCLRPDIDEFKLSRRLTAEEDHKIAMGGDIEKLGLC